MKAVKVLIMETGTGRGGSTISLGNLVSRLDRRRFDPLVLFYSTGWDLTRVEATGVDVIRLRPRFTRSDAPSASGVRSYAALLRYLVAEALPRVRTCRAVLRRHEIELVHLNNDVLTSLPMLLAARRAGLPVLGHIRGSRRWTATERRLARLVDLFIPVSHTAFEACRRSGIPPERMRVIYNGLDRSRYDPAKLDATGLRQELGLAPDQLLVGMVARLTPEKGQLEFVQAAAQVLPRAPRTHFVLVGTAAPEAEDFVRSLREFVARAGIAGRVSFTGWREDIPEITAALDIAVQASAYWEGHCNATLEAMMLGRPLIVADAGAQRETVGDEGAALIVPPGDPGALAGALATLLQDPRQREDLGRRARERAERLFTVESTVRQVEQAYLDVLNRRAR